MKCCVVAHFSPFNNSNNNITLLPSVNTLIARGMFYGAKYTHHTFTPIIKHIITTAKKKKKKKKERKKREEIRVKVIHR